MSNAGVDVKAWIFRKGNGQVRVHPSPVVLKPNGTLTFVNLTRETASVIVRNDGIAPPEGNRDGVPVAPGKPSAPFGVVGTALAYFEYEVILASGDYAEGGSRPGAIIDP